MRHAGLLIETTVLALHDAGHLTKATIVVIRHAGFLANTTVLAIRDAGIFQKQWNLQSAMQDSI